MDSLQSGDILLFDEYPSSPCFDGFTKCIKYCTGSRYSHCALVLRDPMGLKGLYVWESSFHPGTTDPLDHKKNKFGVQVTPLSHYTANYPGNVEIYVRKRDETSHPFDNTFISKVRAVVYDKPYDIWPEDWVLAWLRKGPSATTERFWCSAFVAYVLQRGNDIRCQNWSLVRAQDFSSSCKRPPFAWRTTYAPETKFLSLRGVGLAIR